MRLSRLFSQTRREVPADMDAPGQQLLVRAGYIQPLSGGALGLLPLGLRSLQRVYAGLTNRLAALGALEVRLPDLASHSSATAEMLRIHMRSYRQLPLLLFQRSQTLNDLPQRGGGLLGSRWSESLQIICAAASARDLAARDTELTEEIEAALHEVGLPARFGDDAQSARLWLYPHGSGGEALLTCPACEYSATPRAASFGRPQPVPEPPSPLEKIATPHCTSIAALAEFLHIPESRTAKAVFLTTQISKGSKKPHRQLIFAVVRGDRDVNETALLRLLGADSLSPATDEEIRAVGAVPGYASPIGVKGAYILIDTEIEHSRNLVAGANEAGFHLLNVNYGRDFSADQVAEIAMAQAGDACPTCGRPLIEQRGVAILQRCQLGVSWGVSFLDESGRSQLLHVSTFQLEASRLLGCLAEQHRDERGLRLPPAAAPASLHLVLLPGKSTEAAAAGLDLEARLLAAGIEPLTDDRPESAGIKFNDADLIGLPLRVTISERSLRQGGLEVRHRSANESSIVPLDHAVDEIKALLNP